MTTWQVRLRRRGWMLGPIAVTAFVAMVMSVIGSAAAATPEPVPGSAGTDTALPLTESARTVHGRGPFAGLAVTVNQTSGLLNQAVSITWTGGAPTIGNEGNLWGNFLQIMQCWGDDDGTVPDNAGPPPEQCVQGAQSEGGHASGAAVPMNATTTRAISRTDWQNYDRTVGYTETPEEAADPATATVWRPFRAVDGKVINRQVDLKFNPQLGGAFWLNPSFDRSTTNEVYGARTAPNGEGSEIFEVQTAKETAALGCGRSVQPVDGGGRKVPQCWLVVVPRSTAAVENVGTPYDDPSVPGVSTSPLAPEAWKNRIAIPLEFVPLDSACPAGQSEQRINGSELAARAVASWQPILCTTDGLPPFSYTRTGDALARQQIANPSSTSAGMVVVSRPVAAEPDPTRPIVYAPLTLGGLVIGLTIERKTKIGVPAAEQALEGVRVAELNLTPRLVAKLLTQSYSSQFPDPEKPYPWTMTNPYDMLGDPDFLQFNPEFTMLRNSGKNIGGFVLPTGNSDAARQVWAWVLADPEAKAWLDGNPDPFGMVVNPAYAAVKEKNTFGETFGDPMPESFPKNEPYCTPPRPFGNSLIATPLCGGDQMPATISFSEAARVTRTANPAAKNIFDAQASTADKAWKAEPPQSPGQRAILTITDAASAAKYGLQPARLSRAGDNQADRTFIAPDDAGILAGLAAMAPGANPDVLEPQPQTLHDGAYPLTMLTYAAVSPESLNKRDRQVYAAFLAYGAFGPGQEPGLDPGELPPGYTPLPAELREQAKAAAHVVETFGPGPSDEPLPTTTQPATTAPPTTTATTAPPTAPPTTMATTTTTTTKPRARGTTTTTRPVTTTTTTTSPSTTTAAPVATPPFTTTIPPLAGEPDEPDSPGFTPATPILAMSRSRYAVPGLGFVALSSGLGALEITKRPRRRKGPNPLDPPPTPQIGSEE